MDNFEIDIDKTKETRGYKKIQNYLNGIVNESDFQKRIMRFRKKYKLPIRGLKNGEYPFDVVYRNDFREELDYYCLKELGLDHSWSMMIQDYIIYNNFNMELLGGSMFDISDLNFQLNETPPEIGLKSIISNLQEKVRTHPIAIFISPYASERDIIDYVQKLYKTSIRTLQFDYKNPEIRIGKIRKRNQKVGERNKFIVSNSALSGRKIVSLVTEKYGKAMDYTYVNRIKKGGLSNKKKHR